MKTDLQIFNHPQFGDIRVATNENGEPIFCLSDTCEVLGLSSKGVNQRLSKGVISNYPVKTNGGIQQALFVNEDGLYDVILDSRKPEAKQFRKWITSDVLPSIRKHGAYLTPATTEELLQNPDLIIQMATSLKAERAEKERLQLELKEQQPAVVFHKSVTASDTAITIGDLAKLICQNGIDTGEHRLYSWLVENKYLILRKRWSNKSQTHKNDYMPQQRYTEMGLFFVSEQTIQGDGAPWIKHTVKVTGKGQIYFINKFLKDKSSPGSC